jgi:hypothetical protein
MNGALIAKKAVVRVEESNAVSLKTAAQLSRLAKKLREQSGIALAGFRRGMVATIRCGELLRDAKLLVSHGHWTAWVESETELGMREVQRLMFFAAHHQKISLTRVTTLTGAIARIQKALQDEATALRPVAPGELRTSTHATSITSTITGRVCHPEPAVAPGSGVETCDPKSDINVASAPPREAYPVRPAPVATPHREHGVQHVREAESAEPDADRMAWAASFIAALDNLVADLAQHSEWVDAQMANDFRECSCAMRAALRACVTTAEVVGG